MGLMGLMRHMGRVTLEGQIHFMGPISSHASHQSHSSFATNDRNPNFPFGKNDPVIAKRV